MIKQLITITLSYLIIFSNCFAVAAIFTVNKVGEDYSTISACANDAPGSMSADHICEIYDDQGVLSGWTQSDLGTNGYWIIIRAASGETPETNSEIEISGSNYLEIRGIRQTNSGTFGIDGDTSGGSNIKIIDNIISNSSYSIAIWADDVLIEGNTFESIGVDVIRYWGTRWTVRRNTIINNYGDVTGVLHCDFLQSWCGDFASPETGHHILIENNVVIGGPGSNTHFSLINETDGINKGSCDPVTNTIIRYNIGWDIGSSGSFIDNNNQKSGSGDNSIYNNTWGKFRQDLSPATSIHPFTASDNSDGINNIFYDTFTLSDVIGFSWSTGGSQSHNLYYDPDGTISFLGLALVEIGAVKNQDPNFGDSDNNDFTLDPGSPAIDTGGPLTHANADVSTSVTLPVDDASLFSPGWGGADADFLYIRTVGRTTSITGFESGSNGDPATTTLLDATTDGSGGAWTTASSRLTISNNYKQTDYPTNADGSWYDDSSGSRGVRFYNNTSSSDHTIYTLSPDANECTSGTFIKFDQFPTQFTNHDVLIMWADPTTQACVAQLHAYATQMNMRVHSFVSPTSYIGDQLIDIDVDKWYWVTLNHSVATNLCSLDIYDPADNYSLVGQDDITPAGSDGIDGVYLGNNPHNETAGVYHYYDNLMINTSGRMPLLPTGAIITVQISSIDYVANEITLVTPISCKKGDEVGVYKDSDGVRVYFGNAPDMGAKESGVPSPEVPGVVTGFISGGYFR